MSSATATAITKPERLPALLEGAGVSVKQINLRYTELFDAFEYLCSLYEVVLSKHDEIDERLTDISDNLIARLPAFEDGQIWQMVEGSFVPIALDVEVNPSPWNVKPARRNPFPEWECVEYCASYWPQEYCEFSWPVKWSDCEGERFAPPVWFKDMIPVNWIGYRKPDRSWRDGCILYPPRKNTILPAAWS